MATQIVIFIMHLWRPAAEGRGPDSQLPSQTTSTNTVRSYTLNHDFFFCEESENINTLFLVCLTDTSVHKYIGVSVNAAQCENRFLWVYSAEINAWKFSFIFDCKDYD